MNEVTWLGWDGRVLRWRVAAAQSAQVELCIDGVLFERIAAGGAEQARDFPFSPTGNAEIEVGIRYADGVLGAPWRVAHGRAAVGAADQWSGARRPLHWLPAVALPPASQRNADIAVVVPIFNSPELVRRCVAAVLRWSPGIRLILIDDASTDAAVGKLLSTYADVPNIAVLHNAQNLGYTRSCNRGIECAQGADVVLLNSDTEVGPRWLQRLAQTAYADAAIGTVTAVSDNAGAFSVPELERYCPVPERWSLVQAQRALLQHAGGCLPELPTGNGFCMYVKRELFARVGVLDADAFPAGYGEENDLCQRAERAGFRHVIAGDVLVRHARSASFGVERRAALGAQGMAVLRRRYPDYEAKVGATLFSFERRVLDYRVRRIYADIDSIYAMRPPRPRVLMVGPVVAVNLHPQFDCIALVDNALVRDGIQIDVASGDLRIVLVRHGIEAVVGAEHAQLNAAAASLQVPVLASAAAPALVALAGAGP